MKQLITKIQLMMFSNLLLKIQDKAKYLYDNSFILQNIDNVILLSLILVFVSSCFLSSDAIGFLAIIVIFLTGIKLLTKKGEKLSLNTYELFLLVYFMFVVISLAGSTLFILSMKGFLKTLIYVGFYFSVAYYLKNNIKKIPFVAGVIALCVGFESIIAILQNFAYVEEISTWQDVSSLNPEEIMTRVYGTLKPYNPNLLGGYFVVAISSVFAMFAHTLSIKKYKSCLVFFVFSLSGVIGLFLTGCRGAYLALILMLAAVFFISAKFFWKQFKTFYLSLISFISLMFVFALTFIASLRARFFSIFAMRNDSSNSFRFNVYKSSLQMFQDNWLLGIGVGNKNFREIYGLYMKTGFDALSAYNIYLEIAVESGIFALLAFLGFLFVFIKKSLSVILKTQNVTKIIFVSASLISILGVMLHGFVDTVFFRPQIQFVFWANIAVTTAYLQNKCANNPEL